MWHKRGFPGQPPDYAVCFDPMTALSIAGTAVSAIGSMAGGNAAAKAAQRNAEIERQNAESARRQAAFEEDKQRFQNERLFGKQKALLAASGVDTTSGSPLGLMEDTAKEAELDALAIRYGGNLRAGGFEAKANMTEYEGRLAKQKGMMGAGKSLLTGAMRFDFGTGGVKIPYTGLGSGGQPY